MSRASISKQCCSGARALAAACRITPAAVLLSPQQVAEGSLPLLSSAKGLAYAVKPLGGDTRQALHSPLGGAQVACWTAFNMKSESLSGLEVHCSPCHNRSLQA